MHLPLCLSLTVCLLGTDGGMALAQHETPQPGGRFEAPWAGGSVTFPVSWRVTVWDPRSAIYEEDTGAFFSAPVWSASSPGDRGRGEWCNVWVHDGSYFDWITAFEWSDAVLHFDGLLALRFDAAKPMGPTTDYNTTFVIEGPSSVATVSCNGSDRGDETWLAIAETLEFLPSETLGKPR